TAAPKVSPPARAATRPAASSTRASRPGMDRTGRVTGAAVVIGVGTDSPPVRVTGGGPAALGRPGLCGERTGNQADGCLRRISHRPPLPPRSRAPTPIATIGITGSAGAGFWCTALGAATAPPVSGVARELSAILAAAGATFEPEALTSEPDQGSET